MQIFEYPFYEFYNFVPLLNCLSKAKIKLIS